MSSRKRPNRVIHDEEEEEEEKASESEEEDEEADEESSAKAQSEDEDGEDSSEEEDGEEEDENEEESEHEEQQQQDDEGNSSSAKGTEKPKRAPRLKKAAQQASVVTASQNHVSMSKDRLEIVSATDTPEQLEAKVTPYAPIMSVLETHGYSKCKVVVTPQSLALLSAGVSVLIDKILVGVLARHSEIERRGMRIHASTGAVIDPNEKKFDEASVMPLGKPLVHSTSVAAVLSCDHDMRSLFGHVLYMPTSRPPPAVSFPHPKKDVVNGGTPVPSSVAH